MDKQEFRIKAKAHGKVVSEIDEVKDKKKPFSTFTIKASNILSRANNCLKLGTQKTHKFYCSTLEEILLMWSKENINK